MRSFSLRDTTVSFRQDEEQKGIRDNYSHYHLFAETMSFLGSIGFYVSEDKNIKKNYPILNKDHRQGRYADLEFKAQRYPAGFEITFYQNVVFENSHGGEYDFDKRKKMPYLLEKQFALTVKKLSTFFLSKGIECSSDPEYTSAIDKIKHNYVFSWHHPQKDMNFSLSDLDGTTCEDYNHKDRDHKTVTNGEIKYFRDYNGYLMRGKVYHNINNMWWVITNERELRNIGSFELFDLSPGVVRGRMKPHKPPKEYTARRKHIEETSTKELLRELRRRKGA